MKKPDIYQVGIVVGILVAAYGLLGLIFNIDQSFFILVVNVFLGSYLASYAYRSKKEIKALKQRIEELIKRNASVMEKINELN